jgi:pyruvate formate lyase activating enzyme
MDKAGEGIIFNIKRFSVHDGPGIRTSIFLKGCPLSCTWCHNPEGISRDIIIWYNRNICIACGKCTEACPQSALRLKPSEERSIIEIDRSRCIVTGECVKVCPTGAIDFTGKRSTVEEVMTEIRKDALFYESSGGGVTLTGGEPLFQPEFCIGILKACREENFNTTIETCLFCERSLLEKVADLVDLFLVDMKIFDSTLHEEFTGKGNKLIKENLGILSQMGKRIIVRVPLIKGITDSDVNRRNIEDFVKKINPAIPVEYLDFNPLTKSKYQKLAVPFSLSHSLPRSIGGVTQSKH